MERIKNNNSYKLDYLSRLVQLVIKDIFGFYNRKNFSRFFFLFFCWLILFFSASEINDNFFNKANAQSCATNLPISGVTASGNEVGYGPSNVLDNNLATRWSSYGIGQWIRADLGSIQNICSVDIAWYNGNARQYHFVIATSTDGTTFTNKFSGDSSGTTLNSEKYIIPATDARYVRVTVNGNSANNWANIVELDIFGTSSSATSSLYNYGPSLTLSGPSG
jgi:hypothetical protein